MAQARNTGQKGGQWLVQNQQPMFETLILSELPKRNCGILRKPASTRPVIWVVEEDGVRAVVKDFSINRPLFRNIFGRFLVWRESRAYRRLTGVDGVPTLYRVIDGLALVVEEIRGKSMENLENEMLLPESFFNSMKDLVDRCHKRGVAHCDLKRAPNTILGADGCPYIIDWGASISKKECRFSPLQLVYKRFLQDDYMAITKLKLRHVPAAVTREEMARYDRRGSAEKVVRAVRDRLREILQKIS